MGVLFLRAAVGGFVRREQTCTEEDVLYMLPYTPTPWLVVLVVGVQTSFLLPWRASTCWPGM